ncbi:MAG: hypothetical protein CMI58_04835 [Parcubacteria group bacterium]|nr:hypothetical protein [Parcubacteria group bacterium]
MDDDLRRLMAQIEAEQGLRHLNEILPQCVDLQKTLAILMHNFYTSLCKEGFTKPQALELVKAHGTGLDTNLNDDL